MCHRLVVTGAGLALALLGPGVIAILWQWSLTEPASWILAAPWLAAFGLLISVVAAIAVFAERLTWAEVGFRNTSWRSLPRAIGLAGFLIYLFGPIASWAITEAGGSFDTGMRAFGSLPGWYIVLTVVIVAAGEEWLYRGYAIERLQAMTGNIWLSSALSLLAFGIAHLPLWGVGVAVTTLVSGALLTGLYLWQRDILFLMLAHVLTDLHGFLITNSQ